jgi:hypothetical protein
MILGATGEIRHIRKFVEGYTAKLDFSDFSKYDKYYLIVPAKYSEIIRMLQVKFIELFGRNIARDIETDEFVAHATTVAPSRELFVSFGKENTVWGEPQNRLHVPLPEKADYAAMMAVGYYVVAQIQKAYPHYFEIILRLIQRKCQRYLGGDQPDCGWVGRIRTGSIQLTVRTNKPENDNGVFFDGIDCADVARDVDAPIAQVLTFQRMIA